MLQRSKSMTVQNYVEELRWMRMRSIELGTADGLAPLPMHVSWVRHGILVVGMDNEMHVYTQWRGPGESFECPASTAAASDKPADDDQRTLTEASLQKVASTSSLAFGKGFRASASSAKLKMTPSVSTMSMLMEKKRKDSRATGGAGGGRSDLKQSDSLASFHLMMFDCGMFEAARSVKLRACFIAKPTSMSVVIHW